LARFDVLLVALAVSAPSLWAALVTGGMSLDTALERLLVAVLVVGIVLGLVRRLFDEYAKAAAMAAIKRRIDARRAALHAAPTGRGVPAVASTDAAGSGD
jgi:hypothetical protein